MSQIEIDVYRLPAEVSPDQFSHRTAVVVDILRATSSMTTALANGARQVVPFAEIEAARSFATSTNGSAKLCGERNWDLIPGFDFGNSPETFSASVANGNTFVFTTTNGTGALVHARLANQILLGTFLNLSALARLLQDRPQIQVLCSGTKGESSWEDELFAGALIEQIALSRPTRLNDVATTVHSRWQEFVQTEQGNDALFRSLCTGTGGSNLVKRGLQSDIRYCATIDLFDVIAEYFPNENAIRLSSQ